MLMLASKVKNSRIANQLLNRGADPNFTNKQGSILHYAIEADNEYLIAELISKPEVDLMLKNQKKQTTLHYAVDRYNVTAIPLLIERVKRDRI